MAGAIGIVFPGNIDGAAGKQVFGIPTEKPKPFARFNPISGCCPIVMVSVVISGIKIQEHVVNQVIHIQIGLVGFITRSVGVVSLNFLVSRLSR